VCVETSGRNNVIALSGRGRERIGNITDNEEYCGREMIPIKE
jgi:hypothetical protein